MDFYGNYHKNLHILLLSCSGIKFYQPLFRNMGFSSMISAIVRLKDQMLFKFFPYIAFEHRGCTPNLIFKKNSINTASYVYFFSDADVLISTNKNCIKPFPFLWLQHDEARREECPYHFDRRAICEMRKYFNNELCREKKIHQVFKCLHIYFTSLYKHSYDVKKCNNNDFDNNNINACCLCLSINKFVRTSLSQPRYQAPTSNSMAQLAEGC